MVGDLQLPVFLSNGHNGNTVAFECRAFDGMEHQRGLGAVSCDDPRRCDVVINIDDDFKRLVLQPLRDK